MIRTLLSLAIGLVDARIIYILTDEITREKAFASVYPNIAFYYMAWYIGEQLEEG